MISFYPACFMKDGEDYTAVFPDWNNTATSGKGFNEALAMAVDCLAGLIFEYKLLNKELPKASPIDDVNIKAVTKFFDCKQSDLIIQMVSVDADEYAKKHFEKCVKKTVTIYDWQNREGIKRGINFSKVLQDALTEELRAVNG